MQENLLESLNNITKFTGDNFTPDKYFNDALLGKSFSYNSKNERLKDIKEASNKTKNTYENTSERFIDILVDNYQTFINIGKYVEKIDKNISSAMTAQKNYSNLIQKLRKDIEEFSFGFSKYLKESDTDKEILNLELNKNNNNTYLFEPVDEIEYIEQNFNIDDFLNPKEGDKKWLEEQPEKLRVLIDEKKYDECIELVKKIRNCNLGYINYDTKIQLDNTYSYLIEKITLSIGRCISGKEVKYYLEKMKILGCSGLAMDTFLNWLSKKLRNKVQKELTEEKTFKLPNMKIQKKENNNLDVIGEEEDDDNEEENNHTTNNIYVTDKKIIKIITDYFASLGKSLRLMNEYFNLNSNVTYSTYLIPWLKQEMLQMNKQIESLFTKIKSINELKSIMHFMTTLFTQLDKQGQSSKFIYDMYFINNLKITLEAIVNFCMKIDSSKVPFDLIKYELEYNNNKISIYSVQELGTGLYNVFSIISEFLEKFIELKSRFIGIIFLEEFLFENIITKQFLDYIKNKISKNMSNNYDVKPFGENSESMASSNQILINYGITLISIEKLLDFYLNEIKKNNKNISQSTIESLIFMKNQLFEEKNNYFSNLLKVKIETHFYKFFENKSVILSNDITEEFKSPERAFVVFYQLIKNLTNVLKNKLNNENEIIDYIKYFILDSQYINFLNIIMNLKQLNEIYDTDFSLKKTGKNGINIIIYGIFFIYISIINLINIQDKNDEYKKLTYNYINKLLNDWGKLRNISVEEYKEKLNEYYITVEKYINDSK